MLNNSEADSVLNVPFLVTRKSIDIPLIGSKQESEIGNSWLKVKQGVVGSPPSIKARPITRAQ